jgi:hypothetical protein
MKTSLGLFAINPDGTSAWPSPFFPSGDASLSPGPILDANGFIYVAFGDSVYSLNPDRSVRPGWPIAIPSAGQLVIGGSNLLYVISQNQKLYSIQGTPLSVCQLNVQSLRQGIPPVGDGVPAWETNLYDHTQTGETIYEVGCALTSLSMALNFAGLPNDPGTLNRFMVQTDTDYTDAETVNWGPATRDASAGMFKFHGTRIDSRNDSQAATQYLDNTICQQRQPVIVGVDLQSDGTPGHYVVVTGKQGSKFLIADPFFPRTTLDDYNNIFVTRGFVADPLGDVSELDLAVGDNAELLVMDQGGSLTGFDPNSGEVIEQISGSVYFRDALENDATGAAAAHVSHAIEISKPSQGVYITTVTGLKLGTYVLSIRGFSQNGEAQPAAIIEGIAGPGSTSTFQVQFSSSPGATSNVTRLATFQSTQMDVQDSLQLGLIDNEGIANSLARKLQAAVDASVNGQRETKANILDALKREITAQAGKHINGIAVQVLLQDANSLLGQ